MKKVFLFGALAFSVLVASCDKETDKPTSVASPSISESTELLCAAPWKLVSNTIINDTMPLTETINPCDKDDQMQYFKNGTAIFRTGDVLCSGESGKITDTTNWSMESKNGALYITEFKPTNKEETLSTYKVDELTKDKAVFSLEYTIDKITTKHKMTLSH
jgi:hypothetical protein